MGLEDEFGLQQVEGERAGLRDEWRRRCTHLPRKAEEKEQLYSKAYIFEGLSRYLPLNRFIFFSTYSGVLGSVSDPVQHLLPPIYLVTLVSSSACGAASSH